MAPSFSLLYVIRNEITLKLTQIDRLLATSKIFLAEIRSNNSGIGIPVDYIPWGLSCPSYFGKLDWFGPL